MSMGIGRNMTVPFLGQQVWYKVGENIYEAGMFWGRTEAGNYHIRAGLKSILVSRVWLYDPTPAVTTIPPDIDEFLVAPHEEGWDRVKRYDKTSEYLFYRPESKGQS